jgi:N-acetyl-1-D-myo-inositol-2-amino-2-deoxy-alpha-D-glucopyranoside deacetylase/mycothiol S-conjugate amidase
MESIAITGADAARRLLVAFAHPDDESFGPAGTIVHNARQGVAVHYVCATRGEAGEVDAELLEGYDSLAELRTEELLCAAGHLGLAGVHFLDYHDSGMENTPANQNPACLFQAPLEEVAEGLHPHQPRKLYYTAMPRRLLRFAVRVLPLFGQDPAAMGRNKDMNLRRVAEVEQIVTTRIRVTPYHEARRQAVACHASQALGNGGRAFGLFGRWLFRSESHTRAIPPFEDRRLEGDLFAGI